MLTGRTVKCRIKLPYFLRRLKLALVCIWTQSCLDWNWRIFLIILDNIKLYKDSPRIPFQTCPFFIFLLAWNSLCYSTIFHKQKKSQFFPQFKLEKIQRIFIIILYIKTPHKYLYLFLYSLIYMRCADSTKLFTSK